jgi:hypothetical protein
MTCVSDSSTTIVPSIVSVTTLNLQAPSGKALLLTNVIWNSELENDIDPNLKSIVRLTAEISWDSFEQAESNQLFHLDPDLNSPIASQLSPDRPITVTLMLQPEQVLTDLTAASLSHNTEDWLLLQAWQGEGEQRIGYRTMWDYLDWRSLTEQPTDDSNQKTDETHLLNAISQFCRDRYAADLNNTPEGLDASLLDSVFKMLPDMAMHPEATVPQLVELIMASLQDNISAQLEKQLETQIPLRTRGFMPSDRRTPRRRAKKITIPNDPTIDDPLTATVKLCLHSEGWTFVSNKTDQTVLQLNFQGQQGLLDCYIYVQSHEQQVIVYSILPIQAPQEARHRLAEFLMRTNYGLAIGNFEMDFEDGEIRYRTSASFSAMEYSIDAIRELIYRNLGMSDRYLGNIEQVLLA